MIVEFLNLMLSVIDILKWYGSKTHVERWMALHVSSVNRCQFNKCYKVNYKRWQLEAAWHHTSHSWLCLATFALHICTKLLFPSF